MRIYISIFFLPLIICVYNQNLYAQQLAEYVNPMIGTAATGHTYPGASAPFGMVQLSPDTRKDGSWEGCSGYYYPDSVIYGFSHTHLSGTGCSDYGDILLMPINKEIIPEPINYKSSFNHKTEKAEAGWYKVFLNHSNVAVELTATDRVGIHQYTFKTGDSMFVVLDLQHRDQVLNSKVEIIYPNEIAGFRSSKAWASHQTIFYDIQFNLPIKNISFLVNGKKSKAPYHESKNIKALIYFGQAAAIPLIAKCGLSGVSETGARKNLESEVEEFNFAKIKKQTQQKWNTSLSAIDVEIKSKEDKQVYYTALYHTLLSPNIWNDVDGNYLGRDLKIHNTNNKFNYYTVFSLWDTYRALHPLLTIIEKQRANDFVTSLIKQYEEGGRLPIWELSSNETNCMIGYHAVSVIWDAYSKNIASYDPKKALSAMLSIANENNDAIKSFKKYGYVRADDDAESVSKTLEFSYDDWCIAQMINYVIEKERLSILQNQMKKDSITLFTTEKYLKDLTLQLDSFTRRSQAWKNILDPTTGFMRAQLNSTWYAPFSPYNVDVNYTEANSFQYSFYTPHAVKAFKNTFGSDESLEHKLDDLFKAKPQTKGRVQADITGLIGQYAHGNEPSHHIAYLYNYINKPNKTDEIIKNICSNFYKAKEDGLIGNEDCGQMSAWYVMASLGVYPLCPGIGYYNTNTPIYKSNIEKLINGEKNDKSRMIFYNKKIKENLANLSYLPNPFIINSPLTFKDSCIITMGCINKEANIFYTVNDTIHKLYVAPFKLKEGSTIKFYAALDTLISNTQEAQFYKLPNDRTAIINCNVNKNYAAGGPMALVDQIRGTVNWHKGNWIGTQDSIFESIIQFNSPTEIKSINTSFLQDQMPWIFNPKKIAFFTSMDGDKWSLISEEKLIVNQDETKATIKIINANIQKPLLSKYVKVVATNYGKLPEWHPGAGGNAYIFIDEIEIR
jgi:putative alpha-1,2-mannosidase